MGNIFANIIVDILMYKLPILIILVSIAHTKVVEAIISYNFYTFFFYFGLAYFACRGKSESLSKEGAT